ncbi:MAG: F0F1 ATP synthase subunit B' [Roseovarius sp.]|nr:F0F1 ATP synthase subunit B' [Roseovarius sp.]MCY4316510.1 F0F1 ATP synthase subunit B' [Roseovarius sp.]
MATDTTSGAHQAVSACLNEYGGAIGMPQLCGEWFGNQIFWLVVTLLAIFIILSKIALPRIAGVLADRQGAISNDLARAEDLRAEAVEVEKKYEKALSDARAEAQTIIAETKSEIKSQIDDEMASADAEIAVKAAESEKAISEIKAGAIDSVIEVAGDVARDLISAMGAQADRNQVETAVANRMKGRIK